MQIDILLKFGLLLECFYSRYIQGVVKCETYLLETDTFVFVHGICLVMCRS